MDETFCWILYQARAWSRWSRVMQLAIGILPMVVYGIVAWKAFRPEPIFLHWHDLRWILILLIPWAISGIIGVIYFSLCYSS